MEILLSELVNLTLDVIHMCYKAFVVYVTNIVALKMVIFI